MNKRANRRLVIESTSARSSLASNDSDERSSTGSGSLAGRRRAGGVRRGVNGAPVEKYSPNKNTFGGVGVSQRSLRLLGKSQNQTSSSALRLSDSASDDGNSNRGSHSSARLRKMQRESDQQESDQRESQYWEYPQHEQDGYNDGYDHHRPQQYSPHGQVGSPHGHPPHHQHHQYPPSPQYQYPPSPQYQYPPQSYAPPPQQQADPFQAYLIQQHNMAEIQRQEDKHKAEHERHMAETSMIQQQQKELEKKNALLEQEMRDMQQQEARRRQLEDDEVRRQEQEELQRLRKAERDREARVLPHPAPFASSPSALSDSRLDPPHESFLSNEQLLAEITVLKRAISASSRNQSSDDELLSMFTRLQVCVYALTLSLICVFFSYLHCIGSLVVIIIILFILLSVSIALFYVVQTRSCRTCWRSEMWRSTQRSYWLAPSGGRAVWTQGPREHSCGVRAALAKNHQHQPGIPSVDDAAMMKESHSANRTALMI